MFVVTPLVAAILLGSTFWTGVAATSAFHDRDGFGADVAVTTTDHQDACASRYHSYRMDNDSWLGRDGRWHVCTL